MVEQTVLNFKVRKTDEELTPHAGLAIFGEFLHGLGLRRMLKEHLPGPMSNRGYQAWEMVEPLLLMLAGGGRKIEDLREVRADRGLLELLKLEGVPSSSATGDWLKRVYERKAVDGLTLINRNLLKILLNRNAMDAYTLDIDATVIQSEKREAKMTYKGFKGYTPMLGHLGENGFVVGWEFREGNESPNSRNLEFIRKCVANMPSGKKIGYFRADSATYQSEVFNWCEDNDVKFAVGGRKDESVVSLINSIPKAEWNPYNAGGPGEYITEVVHSMNGTKKSFRLIVIKRPYQQSLPGIDDDSETEEDEKLQRYRVIATNLPEDMSPEDVVTWYNQRGDRSENRIKEAKNDFGMERLPSGDFGANAVYFGTGVMAYNLYVMFRRLVLGESYQNARVTTTRWRLFNMAGRVVYHARQIILTVSRKLASWFGELRTRIYELHLEAQIE